MLAQIGLFMASFGHDEYNPSLKLASHLLSHLHGVLLLLLFFVFTVLLWLLLLFTVYCYYSDYHIITIHGECFLGLGFSQYTPALCSTHYSSGNALPNPRTLDEYTPHQYWSANFILYVDYNDVFPLGLLVSGLA